MDGTRRLFVYGCVAQVALVAIISAGAYTGVLPTMIHGVPHADLAGHFVLIGGIAFFLDGALGERAVFASVPWPRLAAVVVAAAAGIEEYAQRFSARRDSSLSDYAADLVGICFFSWLSRRVAERARAAAVRGAP